MYPDNRNIPGKGMTTDDAVMSSVWLQSHLNSESKKIKWHHFFRLWNEYRSVRHNVTEFERALLERKMLI